MTPPPPLFGDLQDEDRRLAVLQVLRDSASYRCNAPLLQQMIARLGHDISTDRFMTDISWLQEQGYVEPKDVGGVVIVRLTGRGMDVALGRGTFPGVRRPRPSERGP